MGEQKTVLEQAVEQFLEHGFEDHAIPGNRNKTNEFTDPRYGHNLGIETPPDLKKLAIDTLNDPETQAAIARTDGSRIHFYNERTNVYISIESKRGGTIFRPPDKLDYFNGQIDEAIKTLGEDSFLQVRSGGLPALQEAYIEKFGHLPKIGPLARLGQIYDEAIGNIPRSLTRTFKIFPFVGTAITFAASEAEAADLREAAYQAITEGMLPESALDDYESVILGHQIQVNTDPTMVWGEHATQADYEKFMDQYRLYFEANPELEDMLKPPSLLEDIQNEMTNEMSGRPYRPLLEFPEP